jgi:hypothetical protein
MLAIAISLLFGLAACVALAVIRSSVITGSRRVQTILAELAEIDRREEFTRTRSALPAQRLMPVPAAA